MKIFFLKLLSVLIFFSFVQAVHARSDHPLVGRYQGAEIVLHEELAFAQFPFVEKAAPGNPPAIRQIEGKLTHITYKTRAGDTVLRVARNYERALERDGFDLHAKCAKANCGSNIPKDVLASDPQRRARFYAGYVPGNLGGFNYLTTQDSWTYHFITASKTAKGADYFVTLVIVQNTALDFVSISQDVVEAKRMETDLVAEPIDIEGIKSGISSEGHVALDGVYFETATAELNRASLATLKVIADYLRQKPDLRFHLVGHTDSVGDFASNLSLSRRRAQAVQAHLSEQLNIPKEQLSAHGVGEVAPVETNVTEEGRAKNRRVELVLDLAD